MSNVITTSLPSILPLVVFPKGLFSALYSSSCTLPRSALLSLPFLLTTFMQMTLLMLPLSSTPDLITVILSTINSLSLNYPVSSRSRTLLLVLSWKLPSPVISLPSYALSTGSGSLNESNTSSSYSTSEWPTETDKQTNRSHYTRLNLSTACMQCGLRTLIKCWDALEII